MVDFEELEVSADGECTYVLNTTLRIEPGETAEDAFSQLVEAIYSWIETRETNFGGLGVTIIAPKDAHETLIGYTISLVQEEEPLREFFLEIGRVTVMIGESDEDEFSEITIEVDADEQSQAA